MHEYNVIAMHNLLLMILNRFMYPNVCSIDARYHPCTRLYRSAVRVCGWFRFFLIGAMTRWARERSVYALSPRTSSSWSKGGGYFTSALSLMTPRWGPEKKHGADECKHTAWILMRLKTHNQSINNKVNESMHNQINENNYELETQHVRFNQQLDTDTL